MDARGKARAWHNQSDAPYYSLMPSSTRRRTKRRPSRGTLVRYRDRIVEISGEAHGQRVMNRLIHPDGRERLTAVKLSSLLPLESQLF